MLQFVHIAHETSSNQEVDGSPPKRQQCCCRTRSMSQWTFCAQLAPTLPDNDDDDCNAHRGHESVRFVAALPRLLAGVMHRVLVLCVFPISHMWKWSLYFAPQFRFERAS